MFSLLGIKFDKTQTFRKGSANSPEVLRSIFPCLETHISEIDLTQYFIEDMGDIVPNSFDEIVKLELKFKNFPIILGGEHSISIPCVKSLKPSQFVSIDAHPDCENLESHTSVCRRVFEARIMPILYKPRAVSKSELEFIKKNKIKIITNPQELKNLENVYLSIDFDCLDPSILPAVGNPEPNGLNFKELQEVIKILAPNLVAIDFVEFTPLNIPELDRIYSLLAGKLIYFTMAEIIKAKK